MRSIALVLMLIVSLLLLAASVMPYVETNRWFVRMADFPRFQLLVATAGMSVAMLMWVRRRPAVATLTAGALLLAAAAHAMTLWPFRPGGAAFVDACAPGRTVSIFVANVLMKNRDAAPFLAAVDRERPDIVLALETDAWWDEALTPLSAQLPHRVQDIGGEFYGIHLFSRLPLVDPEIRYLAGQDVPAVLTGVMLKDGETVGFIGLHPRPPHPSQPSTGRDAQLYEAALHLRDSRRPTIVAGDLNATPWETTVERMSRIGGLIDPRRGYGYLATYSARSWWRSWPLDQVLYQSGFATMSLARLDDIGSDHYPYFVRLCRADTGGEPPPDLEDGDLDEARAALERAGVDPGSIPAR